MPSIFTTPDTAVKQDLVFLFPGQGSQHYQMARELFDGEPSFRAHMEGIDARYTAREGVSLLAQLYGAHARPLRVPLDEIRFSHPLVVLVEYCVAHWLREQGLEPTLVIACSAGEFAAHAFAGRITIDTALDMMARQAQWACAHVAQGYMLAAMAPCDWCEAQLALRELATVAGVGMAGASVLTGARKHLAVAEEVLRTHCVASHVLPVRVPFHSALVAPMEALWLARYGTLQPAMGAVPVWGVAGTGEAAAGANDGQPDGAYAQRLWQVIRAPFDFPALWNRLDRSSPCTLVDVGPAGTLANWIRHGGAAPPLWRIEAVLSPWGGDLARGRALAAARGQAARDIAATAATAATIATAAIAPP